MNWLVYVVVVVLAAALAFLIVPAIAAVFFPSVPYASYVIVAVLTALLFGIHGSLTDWGLWGIVFGGALGIALVSLSAILMLPILLYLSYYAGVLLLTYKVVGW